MRVLLLAAVALLVAAAPAADASCHFCAEQIQEGCGADGSPDACAEAVGYAATHYPHHILNGDD